MTTVDCAAAHPGLSCWAPIGSPGDLVMVPVAVKDWPHPTWVRKSVADYYALHGFRLDRVSEDGHLMHDVDELEADGWVRDSLNCWRKP